MSGLKEQGDLFWMLTHQETQSGISTFFYFKKIVVVKSFTADSNLLQPTGSVNRTPSHVTCSRVCTHIVNTIHHEPEIHEHIYVTKRLRNNVHELQAHSHLH